MSLVHIKESEFEDYKKKELALVDFYADWCGPCKMLGPVLESISDKYEIAKINVDTESSLARSLGIMSIPTLHLYSKGSLLASKMGYMSEEELVDWINKFKR